MASDTNVNRALLMLDASPMAAGFFNKNLDCVDCNNSAVDMFCFDDKGEYVNRFYRTMPPYQSHKTASAMYFKELLNNAFKSGKARSEMLLQRADGVLLPADITLLRVTHEGDDVIIAYFHDLTEIKAVMQEAKSAAEMAHMYLSASPLAMELFDDRGRIVDCNQQALDLLGFSTIAEYKNRITYLAPSYLFNENYTREQDKINVRRALKEGFLKYEWVFQNKDGEKIPCEITRVCITRPDRVYVVSYIHDLSTVKAMAEELKKAEAAEKENRAKSQFLAQMSHVLLTPMNSISGIAEIQMQKGESRTTEEVEEAFMQIQRSSGMLLGILNDILDLSRAESGTMDITQKQIDIPSLIVEIVQLSVLGEENENIKFTLNVDKELPCTLIGDHIRIKQIANYILSNAFKYTEQGEVNLSVAAEAPPENYDITFTITVSDTGQGMSPKQVKSLFGGRYNEQGNIHGTGLGLTITHRLVQLMNGTIDVTSEKDKGSTFTVRLPLNAGSDLLLGAEEAERLQNVEAVRNTLKQRETIEYEPMPYGNVLVVDDVESNLYVAWGLMKPYGIDIDTANSGFEAIEKIKQGAEYDIIFMDHMMPDMDGIQTARAIMDLGYEKPIVALTANVIFGQESLFRENGFEGFLSKPIDIKQLNAYLEKFIRDKYPQEARKARATAQVKIAPLSQQEVSAELVKSFLRDAKNAVATLEKLGEQDELPPDDIKRYIITTHGMKSALANVGVNDLSNVAATLEDAGRVGDFDTIAAKTTSFLQRLNEVITEFEAKTEPEPSNVQADEDPEFIKARLEEIISACENYRKSGAKKALNALKENPCSKATRDFAEEIGEMLLHGEFEDAAALAQNYLQTM